MHWTRASERKASSERKVSRELETVKTPRKRKPRPTVRERLAVQALLELSNSPPAFHRALSQQQTALSRAQKLFPSTQPGETILMNFFVDANGYATLQYMKNEAGQARVHRMEGPLADIHTQWTYEVTDFPLPK